MSTNNNRYREKKNLEAPSIVAILVSDIHLSHTAPVARSEEPNWYSAMERSLNQLRDLAKLYNVPIVCTGDIWDRWNNGSQITNFAMKHLPPMYSICGNHDLPNHLYTELKKSAFWTLVEAGKITLLEPRKPVIVEGGSPIRLHGFPYGSKVRPLLEPHDLLIEVAVIHSYIWTKKTGYPGASKEQYWKWYHKRLKGFDVAVFGDNHRGFLISKEIQGLPTILNVGGFLRRKSDEREYKSCVGLLHEDGSVIRHYLDVSEDKWSDIDEISQIQGLDLSKFIEELEGLETDSLDFKEHVNRAMDSGKVSDGVRQCVLNCIETQTT